MVQGTGFRIGAHNPEVVGSSPVPTFEIAVFDCDHGLCMVGFLDRVDSCDPIAKPLTIGT